MSSILKKYENCRLCPKACGVDRISGQKGLCGMPASAVAASAVLHKGEEPCLTGKNGSGAVFFSGCTLGCPFCQNTQISCDNVGADLTEQDLSKIFITLEDCGAVNINWITATQFVPSIVMAVEKALNEGLEIPVMWNTSGYETLKTVKMLSDTVDIWLPDIKTLNPKLAGRLFNAADYPKAAAASVLKMADIVDSQGGVLFEDDIMKRGLIVRHLVMPGELESSRDVFEWYARNLKNRAMLSVMVQYTPVNESGAEIAGPDYIMPDYEYEQLLQWLEEYGIEEGFLQAPEAASVEWIPDFTRKNPFPEKYSTPIWHWKKGW